MFSGNTQIAANYQHMALYNNKPSAITNIKLNLFPILASKIWLVNSELISQLDLAVQTVILQNRTTLCTSMVTGPTRS